MIKKIAYWIFGFSCVLIALYVTLYFILDRKFGLLSSKSEDLLSDVIWNIGFYGHIVFGGVALLVGWLQFNNSLRKRNIGLHRNIGKVYVVAVLISGLCSLYIACFATGDLITKAGFFSLGLVWLTSTYLAYTSVKNGDIDKHQIMMIYSFAACFAAVTLRIWLPLLISYFQGEFLPAYRIVAWLCWVPNLIIAHLIVLRLQRKMAI